MAERYGAKIYEDGNEQGRTYKPYSDLMTDEQCARGRYYSEVYARRRGEVDSALSDKKIDELEQMYACQRDPVVDDPAYPLSFVPLITPIVEGQAAHMTTVDTDINFISDNPAHATYMKKLDAADSYMRRQGKFMLEMKDFIRSYLLLGGAWLTTEWAKAYGRGKGKPDGYARTKYVPIRDILVDGRIKDYKDLQDAKYIIHEIGFVPISWARDEYGDEYADALQSANSKYDGVNPQTSTDDNDTFLLLHVWTRDNEHGNLQLIEMDETGLIFRESDASKPYYELCDNEYPFFFARCMPDSGSFYGFGDGHLLYYQQKTTNNLMDEIELACRFASQSKLFVDPQSGIDDTTTINSDPSEVVIAKNPTQTIWQMQGKGLNPIVPQTIDRIAAQSEHGTRFSDILTGMKQQASESATATQNRVIQGAVGIQDKKADIIEAMAHSCGYRVKLALEKWDAPFWSKIGNNESSEMVDAALLKKVPTSVPLSPKLAGEYMVNNPSIALPPYELVEDEDGSYALADIDFDVRIEMGKGLPHGRIDEYNMILQLLQIAVLKNGVPSPLIDPNVAIPALEKITGIQLRADEEELQTPADSLVANGVNPLSGMGKILSPQGSQTAPLPSNLAGTVPGSGAVDKRGTILATG